MSNTLTHAQQRAALRKQIAAFLKHQKAATLALREINAIGLCENEGNPLNRAIQGEDALRAYVAGNGTAPFESGEFSEVVEDAQQALNANGYIV